MTLNLDFLSQYFTEVHFDKAALITRAGEVEHSLYYLSEGIVRFFYYNPTTDKETTVDILFAEQFFMSYASFVKRESSLFSIQALKEVTAYKIGREHLEHLIEKQEYLQIKADILEHLLIEKMQREAQFLLQSPEEIYRNLLEKDPKLIQNIPLKYIASYIGITPQALSRIRKRIFWVLPFLNPSSFFWCFFGVTLQRETNTN